MTNNELFKVLINETRGYANATSVAMKRIFESENIFDAIQIAHIESQCAKSNLIEKARGLNDPEQYILLVKIINKIDNLLVGFADDIYKL